METKRAAIESNLPPGYTFCNPNIGLAHRSLRTPFTDHANVLHCTEVDSSLQTLYTLSAVGLFDANATLELHFVSVKHYLEEGRFFVDGAIVSNDGTRAVRFLHEDPIYDRGPLPLEEMSRVLQRVVPLMLRKSGVASIPPLLQLLKYAWSVWQHLHAVGLL